MILNNAKLNTEKTKENTHKDLPNIKLSTEKIGESIYNFRKSQGLTQAQFANKICVDSNTVSRWERNSYCPPIEQLIFICNQFHCSFYELSGIPFVFDEELMQSLLDLLGTVSLDDLKHFKDIVDHLTTIKERI